MKQYMWAMGVYAERFKKYLEDNAKEAGLEGFTFDVSDPVAGGYGTVGAVMFTVTCPKPVGEFNSNQEDFYYPRYHKLQAVFQQYTACCAFEQMNHFKYASSFPKEKVAVVLDFLIRTMRNSYKYNFAKRLVLNTVQYNRTEYKFSDGEIDPDKVSGLHEYEEIYKWATAKEKDPIDTIVVNHNTDNLIHHIITQP